MSKDFIQRKEFDNGFLASMLLERVDHSWKSFFIWFYIFGAICDVLSWEITLLMFIGCFCIKTC